MPGIDTSLLQNKLPQFLDWQEEILSVSDFRGDLAVTVRPERIREIVRGLKKGPVPFEMLTDLFGMDYLKSGAPVTERFCVVYQLYSLSQGRRVRLKALVSETKPEIDSIHDLYRAANWFEREAWDMFGIVFRGHPSLIRILCHHEFVGHPLRKDYPADGYQRLKSAVPSTEL